jgi:cytochrome c oxidase subunit 4
LANNNISLEKNEHLIPYKTFIYTWLGLLFLTFVTAGASAFFPGKIGTATAIIVTPIKVFLVLEIFMHLRYESKVFRYMLLSAVIIMAVFMALTLVDYFYR